MDAFTEDQLDPGIIIADWQGPQPNFSTYGIRPPQNRWFAERLLRHFRSIHKRIIAPNGHIQKTMIRDLIAYAPNGHEMLGYDPKPGRRQCLFILEIDDFDEYSNLDNDNRGIILELAWRAPIFTGGDLQAEIHFWQEAKVKCRQFFLQSPKGARRWRMTQDQFLQYADDTIASLETELKESPILQETSIRQARPELKIEPDNDEPRILYDLSLDERFNEVRAWFRNLAPSDTWPDNDTDIRRYDLPLLIEFLVQKGGLNWKTRVHKRTMTCFSTWSNGDLILRENLKGLKQKAPSLTDVEELKPGTITSLIRSFI